MIILSYQGPNFSDVRAVKLVGGLDVDEYISGLPEAAVAFQLDSADDIKFSWSITSRLFNELAKDRADKGKKFPTELEAQDALYNLIAKVAVTIDVMPPSEAGGTPVDNERRPATNGAEPKVKKEKPPKIEDKWSIMDVNALAAVAKEQGYKEEPAPNGGVRVMRLRNWLRKNGK